VSESVRRKTHFYFNDWAAFCSLLWNALLLASCSNTTTTSSTAVFSWFAQNSNHQLIIFYHLPTAQNSRCFYTLLAHVSYFSSSNKIKIHATINPKSILVDTISYLFKEWFTHNTRQVNFFPCTRHTMLHQNYKLQIISTISSRTSNFSLGVVRRQQTG